jgi:hypothetical protein
MKVSNYDPVARQLEKQRAREQDDRDLRSGAVSPDELRLRNGAFAAVDLSRAVIRRRSRAA